MGREKVRSLRALLVKAVVALLVGRGVEAQTIDPSWVPQVTYLSGTAVEQELVGALPNSVALPVGNHLAIVGNNAKVFFIDQSGNVTMEKPPNLDNDPGYRAGLQELLSADSDGTNLYVVYQSPYDRPGAGETPTYTYRNLHMAVRNLNGRWEEILPFGNGADLGFGRTVVVNSLGEVAYRIVGNDIFGQPGLTAWLYRLSGRNAGQLVRLTTGYYADVRSAQMTESGEIFLAGPPRRTRTDAVMTVVRLDGSIQEYPITTGVSDASIGDVTLAKGPGDVVVAYSHVKLTLCRTEFSGSGPGNHECLYDTTYGRLSPGIGGDPFDDVSQGGDYMGISSSRRSRVVRVSGTSQSVSDDLMPMFNEGGRYLAPEFAGSRRLNDGSLLSVVSVFGPDRGDVGRYWAVVNWRPELPRYEPVVVKSSGARKGKQLTRAQKRLGQATFRVKQEPGGYAPLDCSYPAVRYGAYVIFYESEGGELSPSAKVAGLRQVNFFWFVNGADTCTKQKKDFSTVTIGYPLARKGKRIWACLDCLPTEPLSTRRAKSVMLR